MHYAVLPQTLFYVYEYAAVQDKQLAAAYCINERTNRHKRRLLYIKYTMYTRLL